MPDASIDSIELSLEKSKGGFWARVHAGWKNLFTGNADGKNTQPYHDWSLLILGITMFIGFAGMLITSLSISKGEGFKTVLSNLGLSMYIGGASLFSGGILGFLFGIPRAFQGSGSNDNTSVRQYDDNTNLEQISDWLTKIIVGVGLIQFRKILIGFQELTESLAQGFSSDRFLAMRVPYTGALLVFYSICGFLAVYIWSKVYFLKQLSLNRRDIEDIFTKKAKEFKQSIDEKIDRQKLEQRLAQLQATDEKFTKQKTRIINDESKDGIRQVVDFAKPGPITVIDDSQKGRWGGRPVYGPFQITASFARNESHAGIYNINLQVSSTSTSEPLTGKVYFFLHESYYPGTVIEVETSAGMATTQIDSYEAFTVGVFLYNQQIKLELDLNQYPDSPSNYKYLEKPETISEVEKEIEDLKKQLDS